MTTAATAATAISSGAEDPHARLAAVTRAAGLRTAHELASAAVVPGPRSASSGEQDILPVHPQIAHLLPAGGLRRGSVVTVRGSHTLLWMLLAEAAQAGSWAGLVGLPDLGLLAGLDLGIPPERLMLIPDPGPDLAATLGALLDGLDLVAVDPHHTTSDRQHGRPRQGRLDPSAGRLDPVLAQRLAKRARHRGGVILTTEPWPGADLDLSADDNGWTGLDRGAGYLTGQHLRVTVRGRGAATRPRTGQITLHQPAPAHDEPTRTALSIVSPT